MPEAMCAVGLATTIGARQTRGAPRMAVNVSLVAERLRQARETLQYSLDEASQASGIASDRLDAIESGREAPTGDDVLILASLYDCDFRSFLDEKIPPAVQQTDVLFRRYGETFRAEDRRAVQEFLHLCHIEASLEERLGIGKSPFAFSPSGKYFKAHGRSAAAALRNQLGYRDNEVPRDVYSDFRAIGIHVFRRKLLNDDISGLYVWDPIAGHCVLVNYSEDIYRQRFSVAHEVAHAIFDSNEGALLTYESKSGKYDASDLREIRANYFASNFLMPVSMLKALPALDAESARHWAQQFRVSTAALAKAMKDAGLVDEAGAKNIRAVRIPLVDKIDPEAPEHLAPRQRERRNSLLERGLSSHYVDLCFNAYDRELISTARLAEMLRVDHGELPELGALYGRTVRHVV